MDSLLRGLIMPNKVLDTQGTMVSSPWRMDLPPKWPMSLSEMWDRPDLAYSPFYFLAGHNSRDEFTCRGANSAVESRASVDGSKGADWNHQNQANQNQANEQRSSSLFGRLRVFASVVLLCVPAIGPVRMDLPSVWGNKSAFNSSRPYPIRIALPPDHQAIERSGRSSSQTKTSRVGPDGLVAPLTQIPDLPQLAKPPHEDVGTTEISDHGPIMPALRGLKFSIIPEERGGEAIKTRKRFEINGRDSKPLGIWVNDDGAIEVNTRDMLRALDGATDAETIGKLAGLASESERISFDQLRSAGLDVRYDAVRDKVTISASAP